MRQRSLRRSPPRSATFIAVLMLAIVCYFAMLVMFDRTLFSLRPGRSIDDPDGFMMTILSVLDGQDEVPLWLHARFAVVSPLMWLAGLPTTPLLQGGYLLVYSLPVVLWTPEGASRRVLQVLLLFIPVFVSFRLAISIYSMAFCLIFLVDRRVSAWSFLWFSFPVFLSSSTMFIYLLYFPLLAAPRLRGILLPKVLHWILYVVVTDQLIEKVLGLFTRSIDGEILSTAAQANLDFSGSTTGFFLAMLTGNPFFTALIAGQYDRFIVLIPSLLMAIFMVVMLWRSGNVRVLGFVLILLASMLSEGVGSYSVGIVTFLVILHRKVLLRPHAALPAPATLLPMPSKYST